MKLVNIKETYRFIYELSTEEPKPVFILKKMSFGEVSSIFDSISVMNDKNQVQYLSGTSSRLKVKYSVVSWENIFDSDGKVAQCNDENKDKLSVSVINWLVREIDKLSGLTGIPEEERKNS